jgi:hypothetical protein
VAGPATITFLFIYSVLVFPLEKKKLPFRNPQLPGYIRFRQDHEAGEDSESGKSAGTGDV